MKKIIISFIILFFAVTTAEALESPANMYIEYPGANSYFNLNITNTSLAGTYNSWCVDAGHSISPYNYGGPIYTANVYSSYDAYFSYDLNNTHIDSPENMSMVNWVINQGFVGQPSPNCSDNYTCGDVQQAIWVLLDDDPGAGNLAFACNNDSCRVNEIVTAAQSHGDFKTGCGDEIAIVLEPVNGQQVVIGEMLLSGVDVDHDGDGYTCGEGDCNDFDPSVYPGAEEIPYDGKDNGCDGKIDETAVPALSPIGLIALAGSLGLIAVAVIRRC